MSVANVNAIKTGIVNGQGFPQVHAPVNDSTAPIVQGALCYFDGTIAKPLDTDAHAATLLGVSLEPSHVSSNLDNGTIPAPKLVQFGYQCVAQLKTTAGETYTHGQALYIGADSQTILNTVGANTHPVGYVYLTPAQIAAGVSVTGAAGVTIGVLVGSRAFGTFI
jgi:hypothetical protein